MPLSRSTRRCGGVPSGSAPNSGDAGAGDDAASTLLDGLDRTVGAAVGAALIAALAPPFVVTALSRGAAPPLAGPRDMKGIAARSRPGDAQRGERGPERSGAPPTAGRNPKQPPPAAGRETLGLGR